MILISEVLNKVGIRIDYSTYEWEKSIMPETDKPNYEKPKIMIIDMPDSIVEKVKSLGFNAVSGTFGSSL